MTQALPQVDVAELQAVLRAVRVRMEEAQAERPRGLAVGVLGFLALSLGFLHVAQGHAWSLSPRTVPPAKENDMKAISAMAMAAAMGSGALAQDAVQWRVEDGGNGHWYSLRNFATAATWHQARSIALSVGGDLVTITTETEQAIIVPLLSQALVPNGGGGVWMGGFQLPGDPEPGGFRWVSGEPFDFTGPLWKPSNCCSSCPGESGENYVTIASGIDCQTYGSPNCSAGNWNDVGCIGSQAAIIEWSADCNSDGIVDYGQIRSGELEDANTNNIPDCCEQGIACGCPADVDGSGAVNGVDLAAILNVWGTSGGKYPTADINGDGTVNATDLAAVLNAWGPCS